MIDIKELRIGNYIKSVDDNIIVRVEELCEHDNTICAENDDMRCFYPIDRKSVDPLEEGCYYEPIPLTEDLLLRCGFKINKNNNYILSWSENYCMKFKHIEFEIVDNDVFCSFWIGDGKNKMLLDIQYLHQLQNLYFALTGKELEVKL